MPLFANRSSNLKRRFSSDIYKSAPLKFVFSKLGNFHHCWTLAATGRNFQCNSLLSTKPLGAMRTAQKLRLRGRRARWLEPAMQQSAGLAVFFFGGKVDIKKKPKLPKVPLRNWGVIPAAFRISSWWYFSGSPPPDTWKPVVFPRESRGISKTHGFICCFGRLKDAETNFTIQEQLAKL